MINYLVHERAKLSLLLVISLLLIISSLNNVEIKKYILFFIGLVFTYSFNNFLKNYFKKERPRKTLKTLDYSFPSKHAQVTSFILTFFYLTFQASLIITIPVYLVAIYNRIKYKHHYIEDIIAGTLLGVVIGLILGVI